MSNKEQHEKRKDIKWKVITALSITGTATLGALYYMQSKDVKQAKEDADLVRRVVGGPLINTLIRNEELKLSRTNNKERDILSSNMTEATKVVLEEVRSKKQNIIQTIADYVAVRDVLKRD